MKLLYVYVHTKHYMNCYTQRNQELDLSRYDVGTIINVELNTQTHDHVLILSGKDSYQILYHPDLSDLVWVTDLTLTDWDYIDIYLLPPNLKTLTIRKSEMKEFLYDDILSDLTTLIINDCWYIDGELDLSECMSLKIVDVSDNYLTYFPLLPESVVNIDCSNNNITDIDYFPAFVKLIDCCNNDLTHLPAFPETVVDINCANNDLIAIPPIQHTNLKFFDCSNNKLINLPHKFPITIETIDCSENGLYNIPRLPETLTYLKCSYNALTYLYNLPRYLKILDCSHNHIAKIQNILPAKLTKLNISHNALVKSPNIMRLRYLTHMYTHMEGNVYNTVAKAPVYNHNYHNNYYNNHKPYVYTPYVSKDPHCVSVNNKEIPDI